MAAGFWNACLPNMRLETGELCVCVCVSYTNIISDNNHGPSILASFLCVYGHMDLHVCVCE